MSHEETKNFFNKRADHWDEEQCVDFALVDEMISRIPLPVGASIIDLACGTGVISKRLLEKFNGSVIGIDISDKMIEIAKSKYIDTPALSFLNLDFYESDFKDKDGIICFNAFPHFLDVEEFAKIAYESLNNDGYLVIMHSLSRKQLSKHHGGSEVCKVSRDLGPIQEEAMRFSPLFEIVCAEEDDHHVFMMLKKKI